MSDARWAWRLGAGVGLCYLAFLAPGMYAIDERSMLAVAESLVRHGSFAVDPGLGPVGLGGLTYSQWYPLLSVLAVPFVAAGLAVAGIVHLPGHYVAAACALVLPALLSAATVAYVALLARRLGAGRIGAAVAALTYAFGTIAAPYARTFFAEPLLALLTVSAIYHAFGDERRDIVLAGTLAGLAVLAKPSGIVVGPVLAAYWLAARRQPARWAWLPVLGSAAGSALYAAYNVARFGSVTAFGPPWAFSLRAGAQGAAGLLVSPGHGVLWYCVPVVMSVVGFLAVPAERQAEARAIAAMAVAYLALYSFWTYWDGGWSWGPRFLLPALPGALALAGVVSLRARRLLVALAVLGFLVNAPTWVAFYERYYQEAGERGEPGRDLVWSVRDSPLVNMWGAARREWRDAGAADVRSLVRDVGHGGPTIASSQMLRVVAVWWWMLPAARVPRWPGIALACLMVGAGLAVIARTFVPDEVLPSAETPGP